MTLRTRLVLMMTLAALSGVVVHAALTQWPLPQALAWLRVSLGLGPAWNLLARGVLVFLMREHDEDFDYEASIAEHQRLLTLIQAGEKDAVDREIERHVLSSVRRQRGNRKAAAR